MTAAIIALSVALLVSLAANAALAVWLRTSFRDERSSDDLSNKYKAERDQLAVNNAAHVKRAGELEALLRSASSARDEATKETIRIKAERMRNGADDKAAAVEFGSVFGMPLPVLPKAGDSDPGGNDR